jgi:hypothetical protein
MSTWLRKLRAYSLVAALVATPMAEPSYCLCAQPGSVASVGKASPCCGASSHSNANRSSTRSTTLSRGSLVQASCCASTSVFQSRSTGCGCCGCCQKASVSASRSGPSADREGSCCCHRCNHDSESTPAVIPQLANGGDWTFSAFAVWVGDGAGLFSDHFVRADVASSQTLSALEHCTTLCRWLC